MANPIVLSDNLTIHNIQTLFDELKQRCSETDNEIILDASGIEDIDTSGFQMLLALKRHSENGGKQLQWLGVDEKVIELSRKLALQTPLNFPV
ncbi:STAS domain-containing protein [Thiomicrorhabdus sp.]|uniref:STAS domain-containing protein n=1 Tax=Thiomicrorhabdus sp. TaxID=2039724 RepID=UPI0029C816D3|nr:STAS domain-containing protein [Thiomicrorhabdus sp.]